MNEDEVARTIAALDQSKASMEDMADHVAAFYHRLTLSMSEDHALQLTESLLVESIVRSDDD